MLAETPVPPHQPRVAAPHRTRAVSPDAEEAVSDFCRTFVDHGANPWFVLRRPARAVATSIALRRLPLLEVRVDATVDGQAIHRALRHGPWIERWLTQDATSVLQVPEQPGQYRLGAHRRTLRAKSNTARRLGIGWHAVAGPGERERLMTLAVQREASHPVAEYRRENPDLTGLHRHDLWFVATAADGTPLVLAVVARSEEWALLEYFRTLRDGQEESVARYFLTEVIVDEMSALGVRYLAEERSPFGLPNGLRHFSRMLGWRIFRVRVVRGPRTAG